MEILITESERQKLIGAITTTDDECSKRIAKCLLNPPGNLHVRINEYTPTSSEPHSTENNPKRYHVYMSERSLTEFLSILKEYEQIKNSPLKLLLRGKDLVRRIDNMLAEPK